MLEGIFIDVHEVVGFLNSSAKSKWNIREKYINILILKLCLSHDVVEQYAEFFFLTAEYLDDFREQPTIDRQTPPPFDPGSDLRLNFHLSR